MRRAGLAGLLLLLFLSLGSSAQALTSQSFSIDVLFAAPGNLAGVGTDDTGQFDVVYDETQVPGIGAFELRL